MAVSQIGSFAFVSMLPPPPFPFIGMEFEARAGVNGYAAWRTGWAADRFHVSTFRDMATLAAVQALYSSYQTLVAANPVGIAYAGAALPFLVLVERVEAEELRQIILGVGGINGISRAICRCKWTLTPWVQP